MVDLERKRGEDRVEEKPRTGSITSVSTVKITDVLGLWFIPNQQKKEEKQTKKTKDLALVKHKKNPRDAG
jgi:hypothetical protein